ncbi:related to phospholipid-translocating ATPase [Cephalotrichum gorgonifer]|uniref:Related to phospholipid-translocating ATPase n=1 Tax=Cephalotrichum gorgonifer TaxID=2041049 RepID=A0AAE8SSX0_9PEZI|nr:related to phospholipid-translocating ATPase [Cephalotrichum gorgonifer]
MAEGVPSDLGAAFRTCEEISVYCPIEATVLGYAPNLGASIFFTIAFGILGIATLWIGARGKTWTFMAAIGMGCILEMSGYVGRAILNNNPWNGDAFQLQICVIILGPTVICAGIYLIIKHVALNLDPSLSRVPPKWYPLFFLPADVSCLVVQAIGGGLAAAAGKENKSLLDGGNRAIVAGICLQVVVLSLFGLVSGEYLIRVSGKVRRLGKEAAVREGLGLWFEKRFTIFWRAAVGAYAAVYIRCIYRIAEMAGGWGNHIMQDEISFTILDPSMCLIAVSLLTIFAPGIYFREMSATSPTAEKDAEKARPTTGGVVSEGGATE